MTALLEVRDLRKQFVTDRLLGSQRAAVALAGVDLTVDAGRSIGIVGESGSGKTTLMNCILGLEQPDAGDIVFDGVDVRSLRGEQRKRAKGQMQPVFQDPASSLNPRRTVADIIGEPLIVHDRTLSKATRRERVLEVLTLVGLSNEHGARFPHELSGGQRQRVNIARALVLGPRLLFADEPTSALDVSVQAQILNLLRDLRERLGLTLLFISHNLALVEHICHEVAVMYLGRVVEFGPTADVFADPQHPYTRTLLSSIPVLSATRDLRLADSALNREVPSAFNVPTGCRFHTRCPLAIEICPRVDPPAVPVRHGGYAACHLVRSSEAAA